jgi:hypothetical protein
VQGRRAVSGKRFVGLCGHEWEHVVSQFAICTVRGCEGLTKCAKCGSRRVEAFSAPNVPDNSRHCWTCGYVWWQP